MISTKRRSCGTDAQWRPMHLILHLPDQEQRLHSKQSRNSSASRHPRKVSHSTNYHPIRHNEQCTYRKIHTNSQQYSNIVRQYHRWLTMMQTITPMTLPTNYTATNQTTNTNTHTYTQWVNSRHNDSSNRQHDQETNTNGRITAIQSAQQTHCNYKRQITMTKLTHSDKHRYRPYSLTLPKST